MEIEQVILDTVKRSPGTSLSGIMDRVDDEIRREWEAAGGILRFLSRYHIARRWQAIVRDECINVVYRLQAAGRIRQEKSQAAYWSDDFKRWLHRYRYYPVEE